MAHRSETIKIRVLKALENISGAAGAARLAAELAQMGMHLQPRTVRKYLLDLDRDGLTRCVGRRQGRELTPRGREELEHAQVLRKVGFIAARVDALAYRMTLDADTGAGTVIANLATIARDDLHRALVFMEPVLAPRLGLGGKLAIGLEKETLGGITVAGGQVLIGTICSVAINGILLKHGIPVVSRFGGLVEMKNHAPVRFVELMEYRGTTLDPLEIYIRAGMTRVSDYARTGSGIIGASFREVPSVALPAVQHLQKKMQRLALPAIIAVGRPGLPLLDIPVPEGSLGILVAGGINPMAALGERGVPVTMWSLAALEEFGRFQDFATAALKGRRSYYID